MVVEGRTNKIGVEEYEWNSLVAWRVCGSQPHFVRVYIYILLGLKSVHIYYHRTAEHAPLVIVLMIHDMILGMNSFGVYLSRVAACKLCNTSHAREILQYLL